MGLRQLEWIPHKQGWIARLAFERESSPVLRRFAHVNIVAWDMSAEQKKRPKNTLVEFIYPYGPRGEKFHWRDSIEDAKLFVEAICALDND